MSDIKIKTATVEQPAWSAPRGAARVERPAWSGPRGNKQTWSASVKVPPLEQHSTDQLVEFGDDRHSINNGRSAGRRINQKIV